MMWPSPLRFESILYFGGEQFAMAVFCDQRKQIPSNRKNWRRDKQRQREPNNKIAISGEPRPQSCTQHRNEQEDSRCFTWRRHATMIDAWGKQFVHETHANTNCIPFLKDCFDVSERLLDTTSRDNPAMMSARSRLLFP